MKIEIFDVEHGACALITADTGVRALVDCGHNSTTGWRPSQYLPKVGVRRIERLVITNYDEDHVSDLPELRKAVSIDALLRNKSVEPKHLKQLKSETGIGRGIESLVDMATSYSHPIQNPPNFGGIEFKSFHNRYPNDFDDENNLSLVYFVKHQGFNIVFPGDLEKAGWQRLLQNPEFVEELQQVNVFVASHHGRRSGCCEDVFGSGRCEPIICIMSDDVKQYESQETGPWYANRAVGINYRGQLRKVFTTRNDGNIRFTVDASGQIILDTF